MALGIWSSQKMLTTPWSARTSSSLYLGMSAALMCCGRRRDSPPAESRAKKSRGSRIKEIDGNVAKEIGATGRSIILATCSARGAG